METSTPAIIISLKKNLTQAIEKNHYNLLSPEVIKLSTELDRLMLPLFKRQLATDYSIK